MKNYKFVILLIILIFAAIILETTKINFPFVFLIALSIAVFIKKIPAYISALILSFIIDSLRVSQFGMTAIFLFATLLFILIYEKSTGSDDVVVSLVVVAVATFLYAHFLSYSTFLVVAIFLIAVFLWYLFDLIQKKGKIFL